MEVSYCYYETLCVWQLLGVRSYYRALLGKICQRSLAFSKTETWSSLLSALCDIRR